MQGRGKHVLCEKLMAWNITQCKEMIQVAEETDSILSIGHQRHYSLLYAHAVEVMSIGRARRRQAHPRPWHRNNGLPRTDHAGKAKNATRRQPSYRDSWRPEIEDDDRKALERHIKQHGYKSMEELVRWRLYQPHRRRPDGRAGQPPARRLQHLPRQGASAGRHRRRRQVLLPRRPRESTTTSSSPSSSPAQLLRSRARQAPHAGQGQGRRGGGHLLVDQHQRFEPYGECVMGTQGTMVVEEEQRAMLYPERRRAERRP